MHANRLRKLHVRVDEVIYDDRLMEADLCHDVANDRICAIIHERDDDFGPVEVIDPSVIEKEKSLELLPSRKIDQTKLALTSSQRNGLLALY